MVLARLNLPDLQQSRPIVDGQGRPAPDFLRSLNGQIQALKGSVNEIIDVTQRIRRINSHTVPTTILTAADAGATATITVASHVRVYADGTTVSIAGGAPHTGLTSSTPYAAYYDDATLSLPNPTIVLTTVLADAQAAAAEGRHFLGIVNTPAAGSGKTFTGGGAYPSGSSVGGEV